MNFVSRWRYAIASIAFLSCAFGTSWAQGTNKSDQGLERAVITKLSPLTYPPLARQTRTMGNVELKLEVRQDGSVASVVAVSGHPLLVPFALENAKESQFACENCRQDVHSYRLICTFELTSVDKESERDQATVANPEHPGLRISLSAGHVLVVDEPVFFRDPGPDPLRVRSAKCLYLWKCKRIL